MFDIQNFNGNHVNVSVFRVVRKPDVTSPRVKSNLLAVVGKINVITLKDSKKISMALTDFSVWNRDRIWLNVALNLLDFSLKTLIGQEATQLEAFFKNCLNLAWTTVFFRD